MIVQPASIDPRSPRRRVLQAAGLALPAVLLVTVVAVALAGPEPPVEPPPSERPAVAVTDASAGPSAEPESAPPPGEDGTRVLFPARLAGLDVRGVRWTLEARSRGLIRAGTVAVAGYLALDPWPASCARPVGDDDGRGCTRTGVLSEEPWSGWSSGEPALPPFHLHPQLPPGIRVPAPVGSDVRWAGSATPVVLLARFDDPRAEPCFPAGRHCGQELVVERVAWVNGVSFPRGIADGGGPSTRGPGPSGDAPGPGQLP